MTILVWAAAVTERASEFTVPILIGSMFGLIFFYLSSLRLIVSNDAILYRTMWRSREISFENILDIKKTHGPFGVGIIWLVRCKLSPKDVAINVSNFGRESLALAAEILMAKGVKIKV